MKAILYAAGCGRRLGPIYSKRPKILLEFGGQTLLERHARNLSQLGVRELVVVTGYERRDVLEVMEEVAPRAGVRMREVVNPDFLEGSILSFYHSLPELQGFDEPLLLMDGDVLYPVMLLERLLEATHPTVLLIDRAYSTVDEDPVLVPIRDGRPFELRKRWHGECDMIGESIGFFKIGPDDMPLLVEETASRAQGASRQDPYEEVLRALVQAGRFHAEDVTGVPWIEIDFPHDVDLARKEVFPAIEATERLARRGPPPLLPRAFEAG